MLTEQQLLLALQNYKVMTYGEVGSRQQMIEVLTKFGYTVYAGQKRLVIRPQQPYTTQIANYCYKISYSMEGLMDNINSIATSTKLKELANDGLISQDDLLLFGKSDLIDRDPYIIRSEMVNPMEETADYNDWIRTTGATQYPNMNHLELLPMFVAQNQQLLQDANRIQEILANWFMPSDVTIIKEPLNYGFLRINGVLRLVCLDLGSVIPKLFNSQGQECTVNCQTCGHPLVYTPFVIQSWMGISDMAKLDGAYGCTNPGCNHFYKNPNRNTNDQNVLETHVWNRYVQQNIVPMKRFRAIFGYWFLPNTQVSNFNEYNMALVNELGIELDHESLLSCYKNYTYKMAGDFWRIHTGLRARMQQYASLGQLPTYTQWYAEVVNGLQQIGFQTITPAVLQLCALTYLQMLVAHDNDVTKFSQILSMQDLTSFFSMLSPFGATQQDVQYLFEHVRAF